MATTDIFQVLKQTGTSVAAEVNSAMGAAAKEIDELFCQLGTASTKQKETEKQLAATKAALVEANSRCTAGEQQISTLKENLSVAETLLAESRAQKARDAARLQALEVQATEAAEWEKKWKIAEEQRLRLEQQLERLRSGLRFLCVGESEAASAEVVSTEVVPPSPKKPVPAELLGVTLAKDAGTSGADNIERRDLEIGTTWLCKIWGTGGEQGKIGTVEDVQLISKEDGGTIVETGDGHHELRKGKGKHSNRRIKIHHGRTTLSQNYVYLDPSVDIDRLRTYIATQSVASSPEEYRTKALNIVAKIQELSQE